MNWFNWCNYHNSRGYYFLFAVNLLFHSFAVNSDTFFLNLNAIEFNFPDKSINTSCPVLNIPLILISYIILIFSGLYFLTKDSVVRSQNQFRKRFPLPSRNIQPLLWMKMTLVCILTITAYHRLLPISTLNSSPGWKTAQKSADLKCEPLLTCPSIFYHFGYVLFRFLVPLYLFTGAYGWKAIATWFCVHCHTCGVHSNFIVSIIPRCTCAQVPSSGELFFTWKENWLILFISTRVRFFLNRFVVVDCEIY